MKLTLALESGEQVKVECRGTFSHAFSLDDLPPTPDFSDASSNTFLEYGKALFGAVFPLGSLAASELENHNNLLRIQTDDPKIHALPWEMLHDGNAPLCESISIVRALSPNELKQLQTQPEQLRTIAVFPSPLGADLHPLNTENSWLSLISALRRTNRVSILERANPPALFHLREMLAGYNHEAILHYNGHGTLLPSGEAALCLENQYGELDQANAQELYLRTGRAVFLYALMACQSAASGMEVSGNLALGLVKQGAPYTLGMQAKIPAEDAVIFSQTLYNELARGTPVEEAMLHARLALSEQSTYPASTYLPVLYTSLSEPALGFKCVSGSTTIIDAQPLDLTVLPGAAEPLIGRDERLIQLGREIVSERTPLRLTLHGLTGQGKSVLAREAARRFGWAYPDGVFAFSVETPEDRASFFDRLAISFRLQITRSGSLLSEIGKYLHQTRVLLVIDGAENMLDAVDAGNNKATDIKKFLQDSLPDTTGLFVTSQRTLDWRGETVIELFGLPDHEGAILFQSCAPQRSVDVSMTNARSLSATVGGHPLSLRLLGGAFNNTKIPLREFINDVQAQLMKAREAGAPQDHHVDLHTCFSITLQHLSRESRDNLARLVLFHSPFLSVTVQEVLFPESNNVSDWLHNLWQRGLLQFTRKDCSDGTLELYSLPASLRIYLGFAYLANQSDIPTGRMVQVYSGLLEKVSPALFRGGWALELAFVAVEDFNRCLRASNGPSKAQLLLSWGEVLERTGLLGQAYALYESALRETKEANKLLEVRALNRLVSLCLLDGNKQEAESWGKDLAVLFPQITNSLSKALSLQTLGNLAHALGDNSQALQYYRNSLKQFQKSDYPPGQAAVLYRMAILEAERDRQEEKAFSFFQSALELYKKTGDQHGQAAVLSQIGQLHLKKGELEEARSAFYLAIGKYASVGEVRGQSDMHYLIAEVERAEGKTDRAFDRLTQSINGYRKISAAGEEAAALFAMAHLLGKLPDRSTEAVDLINRSIMLLHQHGLEMDTAKNTLTAHRKFLSQLTALTTGNRDS